MDDIGNLFNISDILKQHNYEPEKPLCNININESQKYIAKKDTIPALAALSKETVFYSTFIMSFLIFTCILSIFWSTVYSYLNNNSLSMIVIGVITILFLIITIYLNILYKDAEKGLLSIASDKCENNEELDDPFITVTELN